VTLIASATETDAVMIATDALIEALYMVAAPTTAIAEIAKTNENVSTAHALIPEVVATSSITATTRRVPLAASGDADGKAMARALPAPIAVAPNDHDAIRGLILETETETEAVEAERQLLLSSRRK
jgi:hypothetical protein